MPQKKFKSKTPKGKKPKSKAKTSPTSHSGGAAVDSQSSSRVEFDNEIDGCFHSDAEQVLSPSHPQSHDELDDANSDPPPASRGEVNSPPSSHDRVKTNHLSSDEVNSARSQPGCELAQHNFRFRAELPMIKTALATAMCNGLGFQNQPTLSPIPPLHRRVKAKFRKFPRHSLSRAKLSQFLTVFRP
jgi:hypothetical protein